MPPRSFKRLKAETKLQEWYLATKRQKRNYEQRILI